jgi:hypothetical protein
MSLGERGVRDEHDRNQSSLLMLALVLSVDDPWEIAKIEADNPGFC